MPLRTNKSGSFWLVPKRLFVGGKLVRDCALRVENGRVGEIVEKGSLGDIAEIKTLDGILSPGMVDLQVNGGGGVLFNTSPDRQGIKAIIDAHRAFGTAWILPTVISDTEPVLAQAVSAVLDSWGMTGLAGIHIEGPHISSAKRGTHSSTVLRPMSDHTFGLLEKLRQSRIPTMITVAPEIVSPEHIARMAKMGVVVSLGHSNASSDQARMALDSGARCFTHLFNAMSHFGSREPGMVGAALGSSAYAGFICDGHHVSDASLAVALSVRGAKDRMFLVSDAMPTVGGPDMFSLYDMVIRLHDGRLENPQGNLAGAHTTMAGSMARAVRQLGLSTAEVLRMGITLPARVMGLDARTELPGLTIDELLVWSEDLDDCRWFTRTDRRD